MGVSTLRRRLIIEWDDDGTDTDEECASAFIRGDWTSQDLTEHSEFFNPRIWVEDAPKNGED